MLRNVCWQKRPPERGVFLFVASDWGETSTLLTLRQPTTSMDEVVAGEWLLYGLREWAALPRSHIPLF